MKHLITSNSMLRRTLDFQNFNCGFYVVKRKTTAVFTAVVFILANGMGIESMTSAL